MGIKMKKLLITSNILLIAIVALVIPLIWITVDTLLLQSTEAYVQASTTDNGFADPFPYAFFSFVGLILLTVVQIIIIAVSKGKSINISVLIALLSALVGTITLNAMLGGYGPSCMSISPFGSFDIIIQMIPIQFVVVFFIVKLLPPMIAYGISMLLLAGFWFALHLNSFPHLMACWSTYFEDEILEEVISSSKLPISIALLVISIGFWIINQYGTRK